MALRRLFVVGAVWQLWTSDMPFKGMQMGQVRVTAQAVQLPCLFCDTSRDLILSQHACLSQDSMNSPLLAALYSRRPSHVNCTACR